MQQPVAKNKHWLKDLLLACWHVLNFSRKAFLNLLFILFLLFVVLIMAASGEEPVVVENKTILKLNLVGSIVEEKTYVDPYDEIFIDVLGQTESNPEVVLNELLIAIDDAAYDQNIIGLYLDLQGLYGAGLSQLQEIGIALNKFKQSGKPILAYGDYFSQTQYYIASHADQVFMHPMGAIGIDGFGRYQTYLKSALEKLKINAHIFRVGTYKSAVEPFIRDDMSDAAKTANKAWLNDLWLSYKQDVSSARGMPIENFDETYDQFMKKFKAVGGDFGQFALQNNWVDGLLTHQELNDYLDNEWLTETKAANWITFNNYIQANKLTYDIPGNKVGVVVAKGTIYNGNRPTGEIGGKSTAKLLKQARLDKDIKAVVLRVDSPGGSAFASEVIRNEIEAIKAAGKPVVVSMGSMAASGGYWISASADEIWAAPTTITGSIGIFGMIMTFEDSLSALGIHTDGVATTDMAGLSVKRGISNGAADMIQTAIENGYSKFINLVASERNMSTEDVDSIAQGRVWSGLKAHEIGLVDQLGYYNDAIDSAAKMANLSTYSVEIVKKKLTPMEKFFTEIFATVQAYIPKQEKTGLYKYIGHVVQQIQSWTSLNDPMGAYIYCLECEPL